MAVRPPAGPVTTAGRVRVAVVGAGVSGLVLATLLRERGVPCEVFERSPALGAVGAGIQLSPNGVRILHRLGVGAALAECAVAAQAIETRRWDDGSRLARVPHGPACEAVFDAPYYLVHRAELQRCLVERLPGGVRLGRRVTHVVEHPDRAELHFAGGDRVAADVVVGADGVHSVVRAAVVRDEPRFSGYSVYRGLVPASVVPSFADDPRVVFWLGPRRHVTYYPIAALRTVHFSAVCATPHAGAGPPAADADLAELTAEFAGWHDDVREVIGAATAVTRWPVVDRDLAGRYRTDRVVLVGDAAHPMLPYLSQGANQALEDAAVLAECLTRTHAVPAALRRYERIRLPRTAEVHRRSRRRAETFHLADGPAQRDRDGRLAARQSLEHLRWLYGYRPPVTSWSGSPARHALRPGRR